MRLVCAIVLGKIISLITKNLKIGGGSAAPGLFALKIDPDLITHLSSSIPTKVIVTGTNGKTTTAKMLAHFAKMANLKVIRNATGSNLERGIASTLISQATIFGSIKNIDLAIFELDEAAFNTVASKINPDLIVFLNIFRDQLDRYGEIDTVVKNWAKTLNNIKPNTTIIINGDDANLSQLRNNFKGKIISFGVKDKKILGEGIARKQNRGDLNFEAKNVKLNGLTGSSFQLSINKELLTINLPVPGVYHIYDFLAAFIAGKTLGLPTKTITSLAGFSPAFGRVEKFSFGYIFLIKNPAGATQVFETIAPQIKKEDRLLLALNDNLADGTDVSWIWDADFELLSSLRASAKQSRLPRHSLPLAPRNDIIVSGTRANDLAVRLKYAGIPVSDIVVEPRIDKAFHEALDSLKGRLFILPTYTAMLQLQSILTKSGIKKNYWEEK